MGLSATADGERDDANPGPADTATRLALLRTLLATERTLMAWNRTSLSLIGFGLTIYSFLNVQDAAGPTAYPPHAPRNVALALVLAGTLGSLIALWEHRRYTRYLRDHPGLRETALREGMPRASLAFGLTVFLALIGMATLAWFLLAG